jgi:hypothetical protein
VRLEAVTEIVNERLNKLIEKNAEKIEALSLATDFMLRSAKSLLKLIAASAVIHGRCDAMEVDVDMAFEIFGEKMRFLSMIEPCWKSVEDWKHETGQEDRQRRIMEHFGDRKISIAELETFFSGVSSRTLRRDLRKLNARHMGDGLWEVPKTVPVTEVDHNIS